MNKICPNYQGCPIYSGILKGKVMTSKSYRDHYCESEYSNCKRFMVKQATGTCPPNILPNSHKTVEEIIQLYQLPHN